MREDLQGTLDEIWNNHSPSSTLSESSRDSSGDASDVVITLRVGSVIRGCQDFCDIGSSMENIPLHGKRLRHTSHGGIHNFLFIPSTVSYRSVERTLP
jgi:hypothetical protein